MPRNTLADLNNHLFEQLERLNDEELQGEELEREIKRSQSISAISDKIIDNANLQLKAVKVAQEYGVALKELPENIGLE
ncbi:hypothetical protein [Enterococcus sp. 5B3_DIV0040]|uniref:hypothetical protein n=1 Tax=Enterococcus sp. 5B3_DIV0040 TaxID=1834182 RepID=UPI000B653813|nr:hypothetical protein A5883_003045 [Enterococcus sp. 5B3_DIV0040]OTO03215.1 hypothetical protein A5883_000180 [Enterococcus sp. 5B3_DIV0040]